MAEHTPGPWKRRKGWSVDKFALEIYPANKKFDFGEPASIAVVDDIYDSCVANARLIAAAPELLMSLEPNATPAGPDFLESIADRLVLHGDDENADFVLALRRKAKKQREAIAKAEGRAS